MQNELCGMWWYQMSEINILSCTRCIRRNKKRQLC